MKYALMKTKEISGKHADHEYFGVAGGPVGVRCDSSLLDDARWVAFSC